MVRICVCVSNAGMAANVGGPVQVRMRTFDIENAELEVLLTEGSCGGYVETHVIGAEVIKETPDAR